MQKGWPETSTARQGQTRPVQSLVQQAQNPGGLRLLTQLAFHQSSQLLIGYSEQTASGVQGLCIPGLYPGGLSSF